MVLPNSKEESITQSGNGSPESNGAESSRKKKQKQLLKEKKKSIAIGQCGLL